MLGDDWGWPAVRDDVMKFASAATLESPPTIIAALGSDHGLVLSGDSAGVAVTHGGDGTEAQWLVQKPQSRAVEWDDAKASMVRLAQSLSSKASDLPDLAVWAWQASQPRGS